MDKILEAEKHPQYNKFLHLLDEIPQQAREPVIYHASAATTPQTLFNNANPADNRSAVNDEQAGNRNSM